MLHQFVQVASVAVVSLALAFSIVFWFTEAAVRQAQMPRMPQIERAMR